MKIENFIAKLQDLLEFDTVLTANTVFQKVDEWDSLSAMVLMGFVNDEFNVKLTPGHLEKLTTILSLISEIGRDKFDD